MPHLQYGPMYSHKDYAGFIRRTAALFIDGILLVVLAALTEFLGVFFSSQEPTDDESLVRFSASLVIWVLYMVGFRMLEKGTIGYRVMRIRYQSVADGRVTLLSRLYRSTLAFVLLFFFSMDHLWILFDERKQAWHDKVSGFYVVKRNARPIGSAPVQQRVVNFMGLTLFVWEPLDTLALIPAPTPAPSAR